MGDNTSRWEQRLSNYRKALLRLAEIVNENERRPLNGFEKDCVVKRFEFTFECAWRVMKSYAESLGTDNIGASRDSIRHAMRMNLIDDADTWMGMIKWRNETAHNYDGEIAAEALGMISDSFYPAMQEFYHRMDSISANTPKDLFRNI